MQTLPRQDGHVDILLEKDRTALNVDPVKPPHNHCYMIYIDLYRMFVHPFLAPKQFLELPHGIFLIGGLVVTSLGGLQ